MMTRLLTLSVLTLAAPLGPVHAAAYVFTDLAISNTVPNASMPDAEGINDHGDIVGNYDSGATAYGFIFNPASGSFTSFTYAVGSFTDAVAINNQDQVLGIFRNGLTYTRFLRDPATGTYTVLSDPPYGQYPGLYGINDAGYIIGQISTGSNAFPGSSGVLRDPITGQYTYLRDPTTATEYYQGYTVPYDINNRGQAVGYIESMFPTTPGVESAFVLDLASNTYTPFNVPGATATYAYGINDVGQVVGVDYDGGGQHAFLLDLSTGLYTDVDVPGATATSPKGINNAGQIVGDYTDSTGGQHAFLATPTAAAAVPEPASIALLGSGVSVLAWARRRERSRPA